MVWFTLIVYLYISRYSLLQTTVMDEKCYATKNKPVQMQRCCNLCIITNWVNFVFIIIFCLYICIFVNHSCMTFNGFLNLEIKLFLISTKDWNTTKYGILYLEKEFNSLHHILYHEHINAETLTFLCINKMGAKLITTWHAITLDRFEVSWNVRT